MTDAAAQVEAAKKALAEAEAALAARRARQPRRAGGRGTVEPHARSAPVRLTADQVATIKAGYTFDAPALEMGALVNGEPLPDVPDPHPDRHDQPPRARRRRDRHRQDQDAAGARRAAVAPRACRCSPPTSRATCPGIATPGRAEREAARAHQRRSARTGRRREPRPSTTRSAAWASASRSARPSRASARCCSRKVLGLNAHAGVEPRPRLPLRGRRRACRSSTSPTCARCCSGSSATRASRELEEPRRAVGGDGRRHPARAHRVRRPGRRRVLRRARDRHRRLPRAPTRTARGIVSLLEIPGVQDKPALFSTFLMWLLADLFNDLPEVGDIDKPKLVFFFDEAHLLFNGRVEGLHRLDHADRAAHPLEGRRHLLRDPDARRTCPATCSPSSARACSTSCARTRRTTRRRSRRPSRPTRPRGYDLAEVLHQPRDRRGDRHRHEREGRAVARSRGRGCARRRARCSRRPPREMQAAVDASPAARARTAPSSIASRRARSSPSR